MLRRPPQMRDGAPAVVRKSLAGSAAFVISSLFVAYLLHRAAGAMSFPTREQLTLWMPVGFSLQSLLVAMLGLRLQRPRIGFYAIDAAAWSVPFLLLVQLKLGPTNVPLWFTLSIFAKLGAGLYTVWSALREGAAESASSWVAAGIIFVFFATPIPFLRQGPFGNELTGDEPHYMVESISLIRDHDLLLEDEYRDRVYLPFYPQPLVPEAIPTVDGHLASFHEPGLPLAETIPYALGGWKLVLVAMAAAAALAMRLLYSTARLAGARPSVALLTTAALAATSPVSSFATQNANEIPLGLIVIASAHRLWLAERRSDLDALWLGLILAPSPFIHARSLPFTIVFAGCGLLAWRTLRARFAILIPVLITASGYVILNHALFGRWVLSPTQLLDYGVSPPTPAQALIAIAASPWLDRVDGLLLLCPLVALALAAIPLALRRGLAGWATALALLGYAAITGAWSLVPSAHSFGPPARFMVPALPLLGVLLAIELEQVVASRRWLMPWLAVLGVWGLACSFLVFAARALTYAPLAVRMIPAQFLADLLGVPIQYIFPNFGNPGFDSFLKLAAFAAALALLALMLGGIGRKSAPQRDRRPADHTPALRRAKPPD